MRPAQRSPGAAREDGARPRGLWTKVQAARQRDGVRLAGGSAFLFACRILGAGTVYATQVVIARHLGEEGLGSYVLAFSWCLVVSELALVGLPAAALRFVGGGLAAADPVQGRARAAGFVRRSQQITWASSLVLAGLGALGALAFLERGSGLRAALLVALAGVPAMAFLRLHQSFALAGSWLGLHALPNNVVRPGIFLAVALLLLRGWPGTGVGSLLAWHAGITALVAALSAVWIARRLRERVGGVAPRYETGPWMRTSSSLLLVSLATAYFPDVATITLGRFLPPEAIAHFAAAFRTAFFIGLGAIAVDSASLPRFAAAHARGDLERLQREVTRATRLKSAGALAGLALLAAFGPRVLSLFGAEFVAGQAALLVLAASQALPACLGPGAQLLGITGHERDGQRGAIGALLALPLLLALLAPRYGVLGAAWAVLLDNVALSLWLRSRIRARLGIAPGCIGKRAG